MTEEKKKSYYEIQLDALNSIENLKDKLEYCKKIDFSKPIEKDSDSKIISTIRISEEGWKEELMRRDKEIQLSSPIMIFNYLKNIAGLYRKEVFVGFDSKKLSYYLSDIIIKRFYLFTFEDTSEIFVYDEGIYENGEKRLRRFIQIVLKEFSTIHIINEVLEHIRRQTYEKRELIKEEKDKICLLNGILDLENLNIKNHTPNLIFFNKINANYDKEADCPKIKKFLSEIVNSEDISILQELAGYSLIKEYFIHKAIMLVGSGSNAKSTFINLLREFLGQKNCVSIPLHHLEEDKFALANLYGKLANLFADLPSRALKNTSIFKMLTGQDLIPGEKKFRDKFFFTNYSKQIFSANQVPKSPEDSDAFFRRWLIINFPNQFLNSKAKKGILRELTTKEELSGFLNFAIEGLKRLLKNQDFSYTESIEKIRDRYIRLSDSAGAFIMDCIEISPDSYIEKKELFTAYCDYCRNNKYPIISENTFYKEIPKQIRIEERRIFVYDNDKKERRRVWYGIKINNS